MAFTIIRAVTTTSTNDDAKTAAQAGAKDNSVYVSETQTGGRGRRGRSWASPAGNLYASLLIRPQCDQTTAGLYSFAIAMAIYDALKELGCKDISLKWPNDVLLSGKKISGILLESDGAAWCGWLVIGFGVNVMHCPDVAMYPTTSLHEQNCIVDLDALLNKILDKFSVWRECLAKTGFEPLRQAWLAVAAGQGQEIIARLPGRSVTGRFQTIDSQGYLCMLGADGMTYKIAAGDVYFPRGQ
jgi:BirA family transcriptional regulator, biotin operon repressor / biotin---[acetyl-CoA-carboxylase] ligase